MKRVLSVLLLVVILFSMAVPMVSAEGGTDYVVQKDDWLSKLADPCCRRTRQPGKPDSGALCAVGGCGTNCQWWRSDG